MPIVASKKPISSTAPALPEKNATTRADRDKESDEDGGEVCNVTLLTKMEY